MAGRLTRWHRRQLFSAFSARHPHQGFRPKAQCRPKACSGAATGASTGARHPGSHGGWNRNRNPSASSAPAGCRAPMQSQQATAALRDPIPSGLRRRLRFAREPHRPPDRHTSAGRPPSAPASGRPGRGDAAAGRGHRKSRPFHPGRHRLRRRTRGPRCARTREPGADPERSRCDRGRPRPCGRPRPDGPQANRLHRHRASAR